MEGVGVGLGPVVLGKVDANWKVYRESTEYEIQKSRLILNFSMRYFKVPGSDVVFDREGSLSADKGFRDLARAWVFVDQVEGIILIEVKFHWFILTAYTHGK